MIKIAKKYKIAIIITTVVLVLATAVTLFFVLRGNFKSTKHKGNPANAKFNFEVYKCDYQRLADPSDVGVMILDCDEKDSFGNLTNGYITRKNGSYVQGTGALAIGSLRKDSYASAIFRGTDISAYANGSIHISLYVNDPINVGSAITLEMSSSGTYDKSELSWDISSTMLKSGWNDLYLGISDAKVTGEVEFKKLNYFRIRATESKVALKLIFDNIYATNTKATKLDRKGLLEKASTKKGYLMDCDTLSGITPNNNCVLAINESEHKEGTASIAISNLQAMAAYLKETDISEYKEGNLTFWLYVNNASYIQDTRLYVELTSSGICDVNELGWTIQGSSLKTGWNAITLNMLGGKKTGGNIDLTKVNYFRIWSNNTPKNVLLFLDAVRMEPAKTRVSPDGMILNCDSLSDMSVGGTTSFSITTAAEEHKEGTGALKGKFNKDNTIQIAINPYERIDISNWSKEALHFWLYVSDASKLGGPLRIELGSAGTYDVNEHQWTLAAGALKNGWNDITLSFSSAKKSKDGGADFSRICWLRIFNIEKNTGDVTIILDDVRAVQRIPVVRAPGVIADCDSSDGLASAKYDSITNKKGEFKEGTGAFKINNLSKDWFKFVIEDPVDISEYEYGALHFWLYINDASKLTDDIRVELGSGGKEDVEELQWGISPSKFKTGWNEITLELSNARVSKDGGADLTRINWFRIYWNINIKAEYAILDDVRAVKLPAKERIAGTIIDCDNKYNLAMADYDSIVTGDNEHKEGTGAFKTNNLSKDWFKFVLKEPVDISEFENGALHFWLYINDASKLTDDIRVELGSAGKADVEELQWGISPSKLKTGWNDVTLDLSTARVSKDGGAVLSRINWFRIYWNINIKAEYAILDDVRAVKLPPKEKIAGTIIDCDNKNELAVADYDSIVTGDNEHKEGTGAFKTNNLSNDWFKFVLKEPVDISKYENGALHFWLYINDASKLTDDIRVELGSAGKADVEELQWGVPKTNLKTGWNDITLYFSDITKTTNRADLSRVNWFRIWWNKNVNGEYAIIDDIRAVEKGFILNCDSIDDVTAGGNVSVTTKAEERKQGIGAFKVEKPGIEWFKFVLNKPVDISAYSEGSLHFWLYVDDVSKLSDDISVELGSGGDTDANKYKWLIAKGSLVNGWNELALRFASAQKTNDGGTDLAAVNFLKIYTQPSNVLTVIIDDVRAVEGEKQPEQELVSKSILNCDTDEGLTLKDYDSIVTKDGEHKEGTGAFKTNNLSKDWFKFVLKDPVDISEFENGALHFWLYINDASKLTDDIRVELGSAGKADVEELQWGVKRTELKTGWNEITLRFSDITKTTNRADLSRVNWFRIWWNKNIEGEYAIIDDISAIKYEEQKSASKSILNCDTDEGLTLKDYDSIVTKDGEHKEGTGAFKTNNLSKDWFKFVLKDPVDISEYENGALHFWLYINDASKLTDDIRVELGSAGKADVEELQWGVKRTELKTGWNEITLRFSDITKTTNRADLSRVNWFRIWWNKNIEGEYAIIDDICAKG